MPYKKKGKRGRKKRKNYFTANDLALKMDSVTTCISDLTSLVVSGCQRPCSVVLEKLSDKLIQQYLNVKCEHCIHSRKFLHKNAFLENDSNEKPERQTKRIARHFLRDNQRVDFGVFENYKHKRRKYLNRREKNASTDLTEFGEFSSDEYSNLIKETYEDGDAPPSKKKKKMAYEDDTDWQPDLDEETLIRKPRRVKSLRVNTRRKRIESDSGSESSDLFGEYFEEPLENKVENKRKTIKEAKNTLLDEDIYDPLLQSNSKNVKQKPKQKKVQHKPVNTTHFSLLDNDVVSKIMQEMAENSYTRNCGKDIKSIKPDNKKSVETAQLKNSSNGRRRVFKKRTIKITDEDLTPSLSSVQETVRDMVNTVCKFEDEKLLVYSESKKKRCKWCNTLFSSSNDNDTMCVICKDRNLGNKQCYTKNLKIKMPSKNILFKNRTKSKLLKKLPKFERNRLLYLDKTAAEKSYNHCKSIITPRDLSLECKDSGVADDKPGVSNFKKDISSSKSSPKRKKVKSIKGIKRKTKNIFEKNKIKDALEEKGPPKNEKAPLESQKAKKSKIARNSGDKQVSVTNIDKGLFLMTFPEPDCELQLSQNTADKENQALQQGPPDPVKSNTNSLVTNNIQFGTYLLPPAPTVVVANYAATDAQNQDFYLSSVYYQNDTTQSKVVPPPSDNLRNSQENTLPSMPTLSQLSQIPLNTLNPPAPPQTISLNTSANQIVTPCMTVSSSNYLADSNFATILSNLQMEPTTCESTLNESALNKLLLNSQLQMDPIPSDTSDMSFDNQDLNNTFSEDNICDKSIAVKSQDKSLVSNNNKSIVENAGKTTDSVKSGSPTENSPVVPVSDSAFCPSYLNDVNDLSTEALLEYCSGELDAISILSIMDLDKHPKNSLLGNLMANKKECEKLKNSPDSDERSKERLKSCLASKATLTLAYKLLNKFGSFTRLSDMMLRKEKIIQIKKELLEQEDSRPSCQFSQETQKSLGGGPSINMSPSAIVRNYESRPSVAASPIERLQSQLETIQGNSYISTQTASFPSASHFQSISSNPVAVAVIPRNDTSNESRETPSRGSGPRTPARPESAMSQNEEHASSLVQIKRERMDTESSAASQCSFSTPTPSMAAPLPSVQQMVSNSAGIVPSPSPQINSSSSISASNFNQRYQTIIPNVSIMSNSPQMQTNIQIGGYQVREQAPPPNVTLPFSNSQNISRVFLSVGNRTISSNMQMNQVSSNSSSNLGHGNQYQNLQQVYLQGPQSLPQQRYVQPSSSQMNQYSILKQSSISTVPSSVGNTVYVDTTPQNVYALHNSGGNQHILSTQTQQLGNIQQAVQRVANTVNQTSTSTTFMMPNNRGNGPRAVLKHLPTLYKIRCRLGSEGAVRTFLLLQPAKKASDSATQIETASPKT